MRRQVNLIVLGVLLGVATVAMAGVYWFHGYQVRRRVDTLLDHARRAEKAGDLRGTLEGLERYLGYRRGDAEVTGWYARTYEKQHPSTEHRERVLQLYQQVALLNPNDLEVQRKCADMALALNQQSDARRHLRAVLQGLQQAPAAERAGIEELLGQSEQQDSRFHEAIAYYRDAILHDPSRIGSYRSLSRILRTEQRASQEADRVLDSMVTSNPGSAEAFVTRWKEQNRSGLANDADVDRAMELAPEDPLVLAAAAARSERKNNRDQARTYLERARKARPDDASIAILLVGLELRDGDMERAQSLVQEILASPPDDLEIQFMLIDALIAADRLEGPGSASDLIAALRKAGVYDGYLKYFEARVLGRRGRWGEAVTRFDQARLLLGQEPALIGQINLFLAEGYGRMGLQDRQLDALKRAASGTLDSLESRVRLALSFESCGRLDNALTIHSTIVAARPSSRLDIARILLRKNLALPENQRRWAEVDDALTLAERAVVPPPPELVALRAEALAEAGKIPEARTRLVAAIRAEPTILGHRIALAALEANQGDLAAAQAVLNEADKLPGGEVDRLLARIRLAVRVGGKAGEAQLVAMASPPASLSEDDCARVLEAVGRAFLEIGLPDRAETAWKAFATLRPEDLRVQRLLAGRAIERGDHEGARAIVDQIRSVEGESGALWRLTLASVWIDQARRGDAGAIGPAQSLSRELRTLRPEWWGGPLIAAEIAEIQGDTDVAVRQYMLAFEMGTAEPVALTRLVGLLYQRQRFDEIDRIAESLQARGQNLDDLRILTALNALRKGDEQKGLAVARRVLSQSSSSYYDQLFLGRILLFARRTTEAEAPLKRAIELAPNLPEVWISYLEYLAQAGKLDQAPATIAAAARALPRDRAALTLALCHDLAGQTEQAERGFNQALAEQPDDPATLRACAEFLLKSDRFNEARPILARLLSLKVQASAADLAWARRAENQVGIESGDLAQIDKALASVEQDLKSNPFGFDDQRARAILLAMKPGRKDAAIRALEALDRTRLLNADERFLLAMLHYGNRDLGRCQAIVRELLGGPRKEPRHLAFQIGLCIEQQDMTAAGTWLAELKRLEPGVRRTIELEAVILKATGREPELVSLLQGYARSHPDQVGQVAALLERHGHPDEAQTLFRAYVEADPNQPTRSLILAEFLARHGRAEEAMALCEKAWTSCPPEIVASTCLSVLATGSASEATQSQVASWLDEAARKHPDSAELLGKLAALRTLQGRYEDAETLYRKALTLDPRSLESRNNLAWLLALQDPRSRGEEALRLINQAIAEVGPEPALLDTRAVIHLQCGRPDQALNDLREAIVGNASGELAILHFHLARAHLAAGNPEESRKSFNQAVALGLTPAGIDPLERDLFGELQRKPETP